MRGDRDSQVKNITAEIKSGLCSINEGRIDLGREPVEGGDVFAVATNNLHFGTWTDLGKIQEAMKGKGPASGYEGADEKDDPDDSDEESDDPNKQE